MKTQWWLSTDMIGKPGSPKEAGPFTTRDDAFNARVALERRGCNLSVFEEEVAPPVELPTEPTLGWLTTDGEDKLAIWTPGREGLQGQWTPIYRVREDITTFTQAVAVPKAALDELRAVIEKDRTDITFDVATYARAVLMNFLTAVDEANRA